MPKGLKIYYTILLIIGIVCFIALIVNQSFKYCTSFDINTMFVGVGMLCGVMAWLPPVYNAMKEN